VLCGFFFMLSLWAYARYVRSEGKRRRAGSYLLLLAAFSLALMAKPMAVTLPLVLMLLDYWPLGRWGRISNRSECTLGSSPRRVFLEKVPMIGVTGMCCAVTLIVQGNAVASLRQRPLMDRLENACTAYVDYASKSVWPVDLAVYYSRGDVSQTTWAAVACGSLLLGLSAASWLLKAQLPYLFTGWFWFLGMLTPVIGLIQVGNQGMADRYTYLPLIGLFLIFSWGLAELVPAGWGQAAIAAPVGIAVLVACVVSTSVQMTYWQESELLWQHCLDVTPTSSLAAGNLGEALIWKERWSQSRRWLTEAANLDPSNGNWRYDLAVIAKRTGDRHAAKLFYRDTLRADPKYAEAHFGLGSIYAEEGDFQSAEKEYRELLRKQPHNDLAHDNLAWVLMQQGKIDEAIAHYQEALQINPALVDAQTNLERLERSRGGHR
jgi:tetratricopeptide (TPR) repeat protein